MNKRIEGLGQELFITRIFDAPRELVFKVWTDPKHLACWWGPKAYTNPVCELDLRPGGAILIHMTSPDGVVIPTKGVFHEIVPPERLVFALTNFEDESGEPQLEVRNTITFEAQGNKTKLSLHAVVTKSTPAVALSLAGMEEGWNQSLDRLSEEVQRSMLGGKGMGKVQSKDGTTIAYDQSGKGPAVVLVCGGSVDHHSNASLAAFLAERFTVYNYHRRGRGESGDTQPYAVDREVEDIEAVIDAAGGSAYLYGSSSGAALALEAARQLPGKVKKLALWEPPYIPDGFPRPPSDTAKIFADLVAQGRRSDAAEFFMAKVVGMPPEFVAYAKSQPWWAAQEALAHTLTYDATIMGDYVLPEKRVAEVQTPTIVIAGGASFPIFAPTAAAIAKLVPNGQQRTLEGQQHNVDASVLAPVLVEFLT